MQLLKGWANLTLLKDLNINYIKSFLFLNKWMKDLISGLNGILMKSKIS